MTLTALVAAQLYLAAGASESSPERSKTAQEQTFRHRHNLGFFLYKVRKKSKSWVTYLTSDFTKRRSPKGLLFWGLQW